MERLQARLNSQQQINKHRSSYPCPYCTRVARTAHGFRKHLSGATRYGGHGLNEDEVALAFLSLDSGNVSFTNADTEDETAMRSLNETPESVKEQKESEPVKKIAEAKLAVQKPALQKQKPGSKTKSVAASTEPPSVEPMEGFLKDLFNSLISNKDIPKYQFERRIDTILEMFLPEFLSKKFEGEASFVVPEFPLKKLDNNQSNNVDYMFYLKRPFALIDKWLLCELKTDNDSINHDQLQLYSRTVLRGMKLMMNDLSYIRNASLKKSKYDILTEKLKSFSYDKPVEIIYIVLSKDDVSELRDQYPKIIFIDRKELMEFESGTYPVVWKLFRDIIIRNC